MKISKNSFSKLLSLALVFLLAFTAVVPAMALPVEKQKPLTITIKNNEGLPEMKTEQFTAYQLFTGTPQKSEGAPEPNPNQTENEWNAENWNNYTLADIEWGVNIKGSELLNGLKSGGITKAEWPGFFSPEGENIIQKYLETNNLGTAADLAAFLVGQSNAFLQQFSRFVMEGSETGAKGSGFKDGEGTKSQLTNDASDPSEDESTIEVTDAGYYLIVENGTHTSADAVSEYILAVLGDQVINLKVSVPTLEKNIVSGGKLLKGDSVGVSDTVTYQITGTLPKNFADFASYKYSFHDTLGKGLTFTEDKGNMEVTVTVNKEDGTALTYQIDKNDDTGYQVTSSTDADKTLVEIAFGDLIKLNGKQIKPTTKPDSEPIPFSEAKSYDKGGVTVTVKYDVTVNSNAVIGKDGNSNSVYLEYSNDLNHSDSMAQTKAREVKVYSFALDLTKTAADKAISANGLPGAGFVLSKKIGEDTYYAQFTDIKDGGSVTERRLTGWVKQGTSGGEVNVNGLIDTYKSSKKKWNNASDTDKADPASEVSRNLTAAETALSAYLLKSGNEGKIPLISGIDADKYILSEVIIPDGYNKMDDIEFTVEAKTQTDALDGAEAAPQLVSLSASTSAERPDVKFETGNVENGQIKGVLQNQKAPFLPFTGGIGTMIFYILGVSLIAGAVIYLAISFKKRKKAKDNA